MFQEKWEKFDNVPKENDRILGLSGQIGEEAYKSILGKIDI